MRSGPCDTLSLYIHLARLLAGGELQPYGLSPSAILCVRTLRDPLPGTGQWQHDRLGLPQAWEQALRSTLARIAHHAVRPAFAAVATDAQAVLFADRAEMLACLARDWCEGSVVARWWWQGFFKGTDLTAAVLRAWTETPPYVPAALQQLSEWKVAVPFVREIAIVEVEALLQGLAQGFSLTELQSILSVVLGEDSHEGKTDERETRKTAMDAVLSPPSPPPWHRWVPEAQSAELRLDQQLLLAVGLMLHRAPLVVRSSSFAEAVVVWEIARLPHEDNTSCDSPIGDTRPQVSFPRPGRSWVPSPLAGEGQDEGEKHEKQNIHTQLKPVVSPLLVRAAGVLADTLNARHVNPASERISSQPTALTAHEVRDPQPELTSADVPELPVPPSLSVENPSLAETVRSPASHGLEPASGVTRRGTREIETAFGGIFYLVNLGLFLELYGDFTNPLRPGIALPLWDFVALVGRELVGSQLEADPIWALLAELAGRTDGEEPGTGFTPPEQTLETLAVNLSNLAPPRQAGDEKLEHDNAPLLRWLDWLMPYVRVRLQRALGLTAEDDLPVVLCHHWARVTATPTHVDVCLSLANLPIAIRFAGLDRDPGWVPAAGRFIAFHFD